MEGQTGREPEARARRRLVVEFSFCSISNQLGFGGVEAALLLEEGTDATL